MTPTVPLTKVRLRRPDRFKSLPPIDTNPLFTPAIVGKSPIKLFFSDFWLFVRMVIPRFYDIILPLRSIKSIFLDITPFGLCFQTFLTLYSLILLIPLGLLGILVGGITPLFVAFSLSTPFLWLQGKPLVHVPLNKSTLKGQALSELQQKHSEQQKRNQGRKNRSNSSFSASSSSNTISNGTGQYPYTYDGQAWFFINGICTSRSGMMLDLQRLEGLFQRPITGILNRTLGPIIDLLQCVIQRDFLLHTQGVRRGYLEIRKALESKNTEKVILLSHSQGCIISSLILDLVISTVATNLVEEKLEIYTFANAANHFSNPFNFLTGKSIVRHIEHYANGLDPISDIGVLQFTLQQSSKDKMISNLQLQEQLSVLEFDDNVYKVSMDRHASTSTGRSDLDQIHSAVGQYFSGRLFVRWKNSGHLLINHYLSKENNILEAPAARQFSRLRQYLGGRSPKD